ncbi:MAG: transcriptional regulator [Alphaproteobacteria bacterium]|nr:transcriptional regulator [Alphaproteobacteria bacterium]
MITLDDLVRRHAHLTVARIEAWIERGLLRPIDVAGVARDGDLCCGFTATDAARIGLLYELSEDLRFDDESLDTVVDLIDQVHGLRHQLALLAQAIAQQPEEVQRTIAAAVRTLGRGPTSQT